MDATVGAPCPLQVLASNGRADLYAIAHVYDAAGGLVTTVPLPHLAEGLYGATTTFLTEGFFTSVYQFFLDAGYLNPADFDKSVETIRASRSLPDQVLDAVLFDHLGLGSFGEAIAIIKGLVQENFLLDQTTYNTKGLLLTARIRFFKSKADTDTATNPIATINIDNTPKVAPDDDLSATYKSTRSP